jgi:hypothetical protein
MELNQETLLQIIGTLGEIKGQLNGISLRLSEVEKIETRVTEIEKFQNYFKGFLALATFVVAYFAYHVINS